MPTIAIAGSTSSGLGRALTTGILAHSSPPLTPIILTRKNNPKPLPQWLRALSPSIEVREVDYTSVKDLTASLEGVDTVLSAVLAMGGTGERTQLNLLRACLASESVTRFAPSEWGVGLAANSRIDILKERDRVGAACRDAVEEAKREEGGRKGDFEFARFNCGHFMNYLGFGATRDEEEASAGINDDGRLLWDTSAMTARLPLSAAGAVPRATLTEIGDVGRFAAAAYALPLGKWAEDFSMVGKTVKVDEIPRIFEEAAGRKMEVEFREWETVVREEKEATELFPAKFWAQMEVMVARGERGEGVLEPVLNELCPQVRPVGVREFVEKFWG